MPNNEKPFVSQRAIAKLALESEHRLKMDSFEFYMQKVDAGEFTLEQAMVAHMDDCHQLGLLSLDGVVLLD
jgi:hypothetical protein